jgi:hypothetical protein
MARRITLYRFYNETDIPQFGCGWRSVIALPAGRKWIRLIDWSTCDVARVSLADWHSIKPELVQYRAARVLAALKTRLRYCEETRARKAALAFARSAGSGRSS